MKNCLKWMMTLSCGFVFFTSAQSWNGQAVTSNYPAQQSYEPYSQSGQYGEGYYQPQVYNQGQGYYQGTSSQTGWGSSWGNYDNKNANQANQPMSDDMITRMVMRNLRSTPYLSNGAQNASVVTKYTMSFKLMVLACVKAPAVERS